MDYEMQEMFEQIVQTHSRKFGFDESDSRRVIQHIAETEPFRNAISCKTTGCIEYSDEARAVYEEFSPDEEAGLQAQYAADVHLLEAFCQGKDPLDSKISKEQALSGAVLAKYYFRLEKANRENKAKYLWKKIKALKSLQVSKSELIRKTQRKKQFYIDDSLIELHNRGYIRVETIKEDGAVKIKETIFVNPKALEI